MFNSSYRITTVWGIPIKIHISLIVLMAIIALSSISAGFESLLTVLFLEVCIFTSIALHELSHSFVAIRKGCKVREITLMFIGGAAQMEEIPDKPNDELQMAAAGPAMSVLIGMVCWYFGGLLPITVYRWPVPLISRADVVCNIVQYIGIINFGLAGFNLLPAFPMDGGRIFRALLARKHGRLRATFIAARTGKTIAFIFGIYGFFFLHTIWLVFIAIFIYTAAGNEYRLVAARDKARRFGFGSWFESPEPPGNEPLDDDEVSISPPPYENGPGYRTEIRHEEDEDPWQRLFRR